MSVLTLDQGSGDTWQIPAVTESAVAISYTGTETLTCTIWPGGARSPTATLTPTWISPASNGVTSLTIPGLTTATLSPGQYRIVCTVTDSSGAHDYFRGTLVILPDPGSLAAVQSYITLDDLRLHAAWIEDLQAETDQEGFATQCGRGTTWLNDILVSRWKYLSYSPQIGQPGWGAWSMTWGQDPFPSKWLRDQLTAGVLIIRDDTKEIVAKKTIGIICGAQLGKNGDTSYRQLSRAFHREANQLVKNYRAELDLSTPPTGYASIVINCGATNLR